MLKVDVHEEVAEAEQIQQICLLVMANTSRVVEGPRKTRFKVNTQPVQAMVPILESDHWFVVGLALVPLAIRIRYDEERALEAPIRDPKNLLDEPDNRAGSLFLLFFTLFLRLRVGHDLQYHRLADKRTCLLLVSRYEW